MAATPDTNHLRAVIEHLAALERPSASAGEREAARWIRDRLDALGAAARVEEERAHGTYWWPLGLLTGATAIAGLTAKRTPRARPVALAVGALAAAGIADDVSGGPHAFRRLLPQRATYNVVAEAGDRAADRTLVFVAHHDAAHGGLIFGQQLVKLVANRVPDWFEAQETSPRIMQVVIAGPALVALGALTGSGALRSLGTFVALACTAALVDIGVRGVCPGADDNLSGVAVLLELARLLREEPVAGVRVLLVSTGSEESFMEGMRGFMRRHARALPRDRTRVVCLDCVGSPQLIVIEGEGMLAMRDYPESMRELLAACAAEAGVALRRGLRLGFGTDGLIAMRAGYETATLASVTRYKFPANYHSPRDVPDNLVWSTVADAVRVCHATIKATAAGR